MTDDAETHVSAVRNPRKAGDTVLTFDESVEDTFLQWACDFFDWQIVDDVICDAEGDPLESITGEPVTTDEFAGVFKHDGEARPQTTHFVDLSTYVSEVRRCE